jgi:hypothetical protein
LINFIASLKKPFGGNSAGFDVTAKKRLLERELRAKGISRKKAMTIVSQRFRRV